MQIPSPDAGLMFLIGGAIEFAKIYLPDQIEGKLIPILALVIGGVLGYFFVDVLVGITSGMCCAGVVHVAKSITKK
jgi:hypothetical protein